MLNYRMLTPGPTPVPESSLQKLGRQVRHHRTADFTAVLERVTQNMKQVFKTERSSIAVLQGSGTSAMDACVSNVIVPGDVALVLYSGKFAERWADLVERYGGTAIRYEVPWGERFKPEKVKEYLDANPQIKAVYGTLVETSTGVQHDIEGIGQVVAQTNALVFYLDLLKYLNWEKTQGAPFTPARSLIEAMDESVRILLDESMEAVWAENVTKAQMVRAAVAAWGERIDGIRIVAERSADALTVIHVPDAVNVKELLKELELSYGLKLAGAQGDWKGRAFRISNMGMVDVTDILSVVSALDVVLSRQTGVDVLGVGSAAAQKILAGK